LLLPFLSFEHLSMVMFQGLCSLFALTGQLSTSARRGKKVFQLLFHSSRAFLDSPVPALDTVLRHSVFSFFPSFLLCPGHSTTSSCFLFLTFSFFLCLLSFSSFSFFLLPPSLLFYLPSLPPPSLSWSLNSGPHTC
jgi:hypothetical protein